MVGKIKAEVDSKGRIVIPVEVRKELGIEPGAEVEFEIRKVKSRKSFLHTATGAIKGAGDAVELLRKE